MEHFPRTLFETEWQESSRSSYILMTPENYYFPQLFLVWSDHPLKPQNGQEIDVLSNVSSETIQLLEQLRYRSSAFCRDMIKHNKLNDANNIFNRMV